MAVYRTCVACEDTFAVNSHGRPATRCVPCRSRYGGQHQKLVRETREDAFGTPCVRCGDLLLPGQVIHLDHLDGGEPDEYLGWSHEYCNVTAPRRRAPLRAAFCGFVHACLSCLSDPCRCPGGSTGSTWNCGRHIHPRHQEAA